MRPSYMLREAGPSTVVRSCDAGGYCPWRRPARRAVLTRQVSPVRTVSRAYQPGDEVQINRLYLSLTGRDRSARRVRLGVARHLGRAGEHEPGLRPRPRGRRSAHRPVQPHPHAAQRLGPARARRQDRELHEPPRSPGHGPVLLSRAGVLREGEGEVQLLLHHRRPGGGRRRRQGPQRSSATSRSTTGPTTRCGCRRARSARTSARSSAKGARPARSWRPRLSAPARRRPCRRTAACGAPRPCRYRVAVHGAADAPLEEIAGLWERNRARYGITVDRSAGYLRWRVNDDPHVEHEYLTMHGDDGLLGYAIAFVQGDTLHVVDVLVDGARTELFRDLFAALIGRGRELRLTRIKCLALRRSVLLPRRLRSAGFVDTSLSRAGRPAQEATSAPVLPLHPGGAAGRSRGHGQRRLVHHGARPGRTATTDTRRHETRKDARMDVVDFRVRLRTEHMLGPWNPDDPAPHFSQYIDLYKMRPRLTPMDMPEYIATMTGGGVSRGVVCGGSIEDNDHLMEVRESLRRRPLLLHRRRPPQVRRPPQPRGAGTVP